MEAIALPFLLLVGSLLAVQAAANVQLSAAMTSPFGASARQLSIGAGLLTALAAVGGSLGAFELLGDAEPWTLAGGLGSAIYITAGILLFPRVGALVAVGLFIAGQMLASLLLDGFGWLGVAQEPLGVTALLGAASVVAGAWLIVRAQAGARSLERVAPRWIALGLVAGAALPVQGAITRGCATSSTRRSRSAPSRSSSPRWRCRSSWRPRSRWPERRARRSSRSAGCRGGAGSAGCAGRRT
jgi:transporter family-2 protein